MNSVSKIVLRGVLTGLPRRIAPAPPFEAAINYRRCLLSSAPCTLDFKSVSNETTEVLKKYGVTSPWIIQEVVRMPVLSSGGPDAWNTLILALLKLGFNPTSIVNMTVKYPKLLKIPPKRLQESWQCWLENFNQNDVVRELFTAYPMFFSLVKTDVQPKFDQLRAILGSKKFVAILLLKCPQIMFQSLNELEKVSDYISVKMIVRNTGDYYKSVALGSTLEQIKTRHVFLERCGKYKTPNLKHSDKIPTNNPSLSEIYDTTEREFSTKIAGVTLEEFVVFQAMFEKEIRNSVDDTNSDSDSDDSDDN